MSETEFGGTRSQLWRWGQGVVCVLIAAWLILPLITIVPISFSVQDSFAFPPRAWTLDRYRSLAEDQWIEPILNSFLVACLTGIQCAIFGTLASFGIVRSRSRFVGVVRLLVLAPQIVPIVVVGLGIYLVFLHWHFTGTWWGYAFAHTVLCLPFVVVPVTAALQVFDQRLELASASLGAGPVATFRQVTFPLIRPAILSGTLLAFLGSFDELVVALFLQSPSFLTLPVQLYRSMTDTIDPTVAAVATIEMTLVVIGVVATQIFHGKKLRSAAASNKSH
ncbi:ABC transporter permease [Burkholderia stabilis]|uniref:ABC transporter permease n=1 Tax=Burkholderia stabilis TaxID=95485 RepID=UPI001F4B98CF|nr:ABC transporter permease [Burkholderia stabilis]